MSPRLLWLVLMAALFAGGARAAPVTFRLAAEPALSSSGPMGLSKYEYI